MQKLLVLGNQLTLYVGPLPDVAEHQHSASALCMTLGSPIRARESAGSPWQSYEKLFVPAGVRHALSFDGQPVAVLFFEELSQIYRSFLGQYSIPKTCLSELHHIANDWLEDIDAHEGNQISNGEELLEKIAHKLLPNAGRLGQVDPRVLAVAKLMQQNPDQNFSAKELADSVFISPSRLSALFSENMGLPLRRYRIWLRLRSTAVFLSKGMSLTEAAVMAGFSDSAHFSNSCRKLLGVKPTDVLSNTGSMQLLFSSRI